MKLGALLGMLEKGFPVPPLVQLVVLIELGLFLTAAAVDLDFLYFALSLWVYAPFLSRGKQ